MDVQSYEVISVNEAKGRFNLWVSDSTGKELCIKWNDNGNEFGKRTFEKEIEIYRWLEGETSVPKVVYSKSILATEYIKGGCTLREWLEKNSDKELFRHLIRGTMQKYKKYLEKINEHTLTGIKQFQGEEQFYKFLNKLFYSGPYGTKVYKCEKIRNKFLRQILKKWYAADIKTGKLLLHGDFHLNNILIDGKEPYIVDFENIVYGNVNIELAYWYVQVWVMIYDNAGLLNILIEEMKREIREVFDAEEFGRIVKAYEIAILANRRFHKNEKRAKTRDILARAAAPVEY